MFYDYYGFPAEAYEINYPAPGSPELAQALPPCWSKTASRRAIDPERGFDHGLFIPLKMMYPQADIPCLQLSLLRGLDPAAHLALGRALRGSMPARTSWSSARASRSTTCAPSPGAAWARPTRPTISSRTG